MIKYGFILFFKLCICFTIAAQIDKDSIVLKEEEYKAYREDQFYISLTYNIINNRPNTINQSGFSPGVHLGFIRDMPINSNRNLALGLGLGLSANIYNQNLGITESNNTIEFFQADSNGNTVSQNRFSTYIIELPFELRWRSSTATKYNFWRIYSGFKLGYMLFNTSRIESDILSQRLTNISAFNRFQYGLTLSIGNGTWNAYAYYGLNSLFKDDYMLESEVLEPSELKIGLMFYIL